MLNRLRGQQWRLKRSQVIKLKRNLLKIKQLRRKMKIQNKMIKKRKLINNRIKLSLLQILKIRWKMTLNWVIWQKWNLNQRMRQNRQPNRLKSLLPLLQLKIQCYKSFNKDKINNCLKLPKRRRQSSWTKRPRRQAIRLISSSSKACSL